MRIFSRVGCLIAGALVLCAMVPAPAAHGQEPVRLEGVAKEPQNWPTYYGNYSAWSYSPLTQVNRENVKQLVPAWVFSAGFPMTNPSLKAGLESAPLVLDGVLYLVSMQNNVHALEAATGKILWSYIYNWPDKDIPGSKGSRGLAMGEGLIYMGTQDTYVVALDAKTGKQVWKVPVDDVFKCRCTITSPPLYARGKLFVGTSGGDGAFRGYLKALDAKTGKELWRFDTIPEPTQPGGQTWTGESWRIGGAATWLQGSYDPALNLLYWGIGNGSPNLVGEGREGDNLYAASLVALDPETGRLKWYYQETPHDVYDYDSNMEPVLIDVREGGRERKLVIHSSKNGYAYVLERDTGKFVRAFPFAATVNWSKGLDANGKPIDPFIPSTTNTERLTCPGTAGARNFNHSAYSPRTGWWYSSSTELCSHMTPPAKRGEGAVLRQGRRRNPDSDPYIAAFDPLTGKKQWTFFTQYVNQSSLLTTAGDLIFGGDLDGEAFALDARTGKKLWSFNTGSRIVSPPVSFSVDGRQFVAIASGGGALVDSQVATYWPESKDRQPQVGANLFVFALPERTR